MIFINGYLINENMIKAAVPYIKKLNEDELGYPPEMTKILFTDVSEKIFTTLRTQDLYSELERINSPLR